MNNLISANVGTSGTFSMPQVQEQREPEVGRELRQANENLSYVENIVEELESKLSQSILATRAEPETAQGNTPEPMRVPLAQNLYEHASRLERVRAQLASILARIEV